MDRWHCSPGRPVHGDRGRLRPHRARQHGSFTIRHTRHRRSLRPGRGRARPGRRTACHSQDDRRSLLRPGLPARAGPPLANGTDTSGWPRPAFGNLRRPHLRDGCLSAHTRLVWSRRAIAGGSRTQRRSDPRGLRAGRQCLHLSQDRPLRAPFSRSSCCCATNPNPGEQPTASLPPR